MPNDIRIAPDTTLAGAAYHTVEVVDTGRVFRCRPGESLLAAVVKTNNHEVPIGCRGGGCGVCKVEILTGSFTTKVMSRRQVSEDDERCNRLLACCVFPAADLSIKVVGRTRRSPA
ncbi:ferredoxin [Pandoraea terrae]|uniref:Ferredoxin n=2 Tax=Pandoraea terrae TaxID=1537710 RepID=A0A5E4U8K1_9BURK|nr:ferredoxin [Pandoraea terrae]